jgi:integration host factor subunit beta
MPTVNKSSLVGAVANTAQLTTAETETVVNTIFDAIAAALAKRQDRVAGFGSFRVRQRRPAARRNPKSGSPVLVPARRVPYFRPPKLVREWLAAEDNSIRPKLGKGRSA